MHQLTQSPRNIRAHEAQIDIALTHGHAVRSALVASWARSAAHGLHPSSARPCETTLDARALKGLREEMAVFSEVARPTIERLTQMIETLGAGVVLADHRGQVFERHTSPNATEAFNTSGLCCGADWSEARAGTNGIGTAVAEERSVFIHRDQHYLSQNINLSCASTPIWGPDGRLCAVLDVSTAAHRLEQGLATLLCHNLVEAAKRIEAAFFTRHYAKARIVLVPSEAPHGGGLLAVDGDDLVIGANRAARQHLGLSGDLARAPRPAADLLSQTAPPERLEDGERAVITRALARHSGNVSAAARALGLSRATLHRRLNQSVK